MSAARRIEVKGIVQGVGFRPFIYNLAHQHQLHGWVKNTSNGVIIEVEGDAEHLDPFIDQIRTLAPPLSHIDSIQYEDINPNGHTDFHILESESIPGAFVPISPDVSICDDCRQELFDPANPRYRYPFINCTNCGPRFSIIQDIPYDRPATTMASFRMCSFCQGEYDDPGNRRFHAQPVACPECGPHIWLEINGKRSAEREEALQMARALLKKGNILAIKGLGGFHLACDARNNKAVQTLRERKKRTDKPFAVMTFDPQSAQHYTQLEPAELDLLTSKERPIVLAKKKATDGLSPLVAPGNDRLGIMLPYTPLHLLLLEPQEGFPDIFVMTSANISEEPIAYTNDDATSKLENIADGFLMHDRAIHMRIDDSVVASFRDGPYFSRRARGFAPQPIPLPHSAPMLLAAGAELKNTFCLSNERYAFLSHHIGDLENAETLRSYQEAVGHYEHIFRIQPTAIACDLHPDYLATHYATERACREELPLIPVQHHHAHLAACLADNQWDKDEPVIGVILDGTGLGSDGTIWGGEFLVGNYNGFERKYHLASVPQPGGDAATLNPARMALAHLWSAGIAWEDSLPPVQHLTKEERSILERQLERSINTPPTSSMGRFFDAASALIGVRQKVTYEAQAAIELEALCMEEVQDAYPFAIEGDQLNCAPLWQALIQDLHNKTAPAILATRFHNSVIQMILETASNIRQQTGCTTIVLSGGVWQNMFLLTHCVPLLEEAGFHVLWHWRVPTNDGGIALGQIMVAMRSLELENRGK
ncbi:MAG TPA: carbamoyltransferase HypF [Anaerolineaceae bacterium]|uniref:Carbamoyltransferase n=1 Tax=Anaerolinea thermophila TaxID=167964 RepID=A0A101FYZ1_9CHLR|nr:MAG: Hydrogenase maturation protein HypF [Anaerolinea thermophila]HAF60818.1 carbamoyltransferase HypF [Anaerolineaceae bacterium]